MSGTRPYKIWTGIKTRCNTKTDPNYKNYGARGITMCEEWNSFIKFWEDMRDGYLDEFSINRIDNEKGYYKENCNWATTTQQARNKRNSVHLAMGSEIRNIKDWADLFGIKGKILENRINSGQPLHMAVRIKCLKEEQTKRNKEIIKLYERSPYSLDQIARIHHMSTENVYLIVRNYKKTLNNKK